MKNNKLLIALLILAAFVAGAFTSKQLLGPITAIDVKSAANIMGLEFTQAEIDSLLPELEDYRKNYENNRKEPLPNSLSPALVFQPVPSGFKMEPIQKPVNFYEATNTEMPKVYDRLAYYSIKELAYLLKTKQVTSVELTKFFIERLKKYDPKLHCVITLTEDLAMEQAKRADKEIADGKYRGMLHGIPYGAKDLLATKRYKTTWGAKPYKEQQLDYDATVIQKLEEAGAVLVAKLSMGALAWGDVWFGAMTRNPWDLESGSSGSSAGSASAVSAGLVPFAIGTETLGSIISPSTVCGTTGLRPTFGRVSRHGAMALSWSMDKIGPISRSAEDCAIVLNAMYGPDGKDPSVIKAPFNYRTGMSSIRSIKVGFVRDDFFKDYPFAENDRATLDSLRAIGYELVPITLPELPDIGFILDAEAAAAFDDLTTSGQDDLLTRQVRNAWPNTFRQARFIPAVEYIKANRIRTKLIEEMQKVFAEVDVYVHPSWASSSLRLTNYTGQPSIVVPNGFKDGKPTSISFTANLFNEAQLVAIAQAFQDATLFDNRHPDLDK